MCVWYFCIPHLPHDWLNRWLHECVGVQVFLIMCTMSVTVGAVNEQPSRPRNTATLCILLQWRPWPVRFSKPYECSQVLYYCTANACNDCISQKPVRQQRCPCRAAPWLRVSVAQVGFEPKAEWPSRVGAAQEAVVGDWGSRLMSVLQSATLASDMNNLPGDEIG